MGLGLRRAYPEAVGQPLRLRCRREDGKVVLVSQREDHRERYGNDAVAAGAEVLFRHLAGCQHGACILGLGEDRQRTRPVVLVGERHFESALRDRAGSHDERHFRVGAVQREPLGAEIDDDLLRPRRGVFGEGSGRQVIGAAHGQRPAEILRHGGFQRQRLHHRIAVLVQQVVGQIEFHHGENVAELQFHGGHHGRHAFRRRVKTSVRFPRVGLFGRGRRRDGFRVGRRTRIGVIGVEAVVVVRGVGDHGVRFRGAGERRRFALGGRRVPGVGVLAHRRILCVVACAGGENADLGARFPGAVRHASLEVDT